MNRSLAAAGVAAALLATTAAAEVEYSVEAGVGTSDNIGRTAEDEESSTILTTGLDLKWLREEGLVNADVDVDLSYFIYDDSDYDSEIVGLATADLRLRFMPDRFEWVITDSFGQTQTDPFAASTPANRENVNFLSTGPDLIFRLGSVAAVTMFGRYSMTTYEDSNFDDTRALGGLSISRNISQRSTVSLNATTERIEFDDPLVGSDFDRQSYYVAYESSGARTRISAEGGYSEIHDFSDSNSYPLIQLNIARDLSPRTVLTLNGGVRTSDSASSLGADDVFGGGGPTRPGRISTTGTFEIRDAGISWQFTAPRTVFTAGLGYEENLYDNESQGDRTRHTVHLTARRQLSSRISLEGHAGLYSNDFEESGQEDDEMQFGIQLAWHATGRLWIEFDVDHVDRDSNVDTTEFSETRAFLRFAWSNAGNRADER